MDQQADRMMTILVVDDDDADVLMIEEALEGAAPGTTVERAEDGRAALDLLEAKSSGDDLPDLFSSA